MAGFCSRATYCSGQIARDQHSAPHIYFNRNNRNSFIYIFKDVLKLEQVQDITH